MYKSGEAMMPTLLRFQFPFGCFLCVRRQCTDTTCFTIILIIVNVQADWHTLIKGIDFCHGMYVRPFLVCLVQ